MTADEKELNESAVTTRTEKKQVEERVAIGANVVYEAIRREAGTVGTGSWVIGGFFHARRGAAGSSPTGPTWRPLIASLGYSVGFLMVILGRQQLFTENTLTVVLPPLLRKNVSLGLQVLRLWAVVLSANLFRNLFVCTGSGPN